MRQLSLDETKQFQYELSQLGRSPSPRMAQALTEVYEQRVRPMLPGERFIPSDLQGLKLGDIGFVLDNNSQREEFAQRVICWFAQIGMLDQEGRRTTRGLFL